MNLFRILAVLVLHSSIFLTDRFDHRLGECRSLATHVGDVIIGMTALISDVTVDEGEPVTPGDISEPMTRA